MGSSSETLWFSSVRRSVVVALFSSLEYYYQYLTGLAVFGLGLGFASAVAVVGKGIGRQDVVREGVAQQHIAQQDFVGQDAFRG